MSAVENNIDYKKLLERPIINFDFSVRTYNCLLIKNIFRFGELVQLSENELLRIKNFGRKCLEEINNIVGAYGLRLNLEIINWEELNNEELENIIKPQIFNEYNISNNSAVNYEWLLKSQVNCFKLSVRTLNCLKNNNINTFGELIQQNEYDLLKIKNFGQKSFFEIKRLLERYGLKLGLKLNDGINKSAEEIQSIIIHKFKEDSISRKITNQYLINIDKLDISSDLKNRLFSKNLIKIGDLIKYSVDELMLLFRLSQKDIVEIQLALSRYKIKILISKNKTFITNREKEKSSENPDAISDVNIVNYTIEDELDILAKRANNERNSLIVSRLLGWDSKGEKTLECVGQEFSLTRERIRQIYEQYLRKIQHRLLDLRNNLMIIPKCLDIIQSKVPVVMDKIESELIKNKLLRDKFNIVGILTACRLLKLKTDIRIYKINKKTIICREIDIPIIRNIIVTAIKRISTHGLANIYDIKQLIEDRSINKYQKEFICDVISTRNDFSWIDESGGWFWLKRIPKNRLISIIKKILSVCPDISLQELRAGISRYNRVRGIVPPLRVLAEICKQNEWCRFEGDRVIRKEEIDWESILGDTNEKKIFDILREKGPVMTRTKLEEEYLKKGLNETTFYIYLGNSPIITRHCKGIYGLRGHNPPPGLIESLKETIVDEKIKIDYGWKSPAEIWTIHKVNSLMLNTGVISIPYAMKKYLQGEFLCFALDEVLIGKLRIKECNAWGIGKYLRRNCEINDLILIIYNLSNKRSEISIGNEELVSDMDSISFNSNNTLMKM